MTIMPNMTVFAILFGNRMRLSDQRINELAVSALVHDLGMAKISDSILKKETELSTDEFREIRQHPNHTVKIIEDAVDFDDEADSSIIKIIYQVHEREDGSGYPRRLKSNQIDPLAKILAVADVFEAFSHPRHYRDSFMAHEAIQKVIKLKGSELAPDVLKALVMELSIFPLGSYIQLNNKQICRVIKTNKAHTLRPVVEIKFDETRNKVEPPIKINLEEMPFLFATKTLTSREIEELDAEKNE